MHISDGVLGMGQCALGYVAGAGMLAVTTRNIKQEEVPGISIMSAAFFVSSLIHVKLGVTSVHLSFIGLLGIILGVRAPIAMFIGLIFQAVMFGHGGITTLGVNTLVFGSAALLVYYIMKIISPMVRNSTVFSLVSAIASFTGVFIASFMVYVIIAFNGIGFNNLAIIFSVSNMVLGLMESIITFFVIRQLLIVKPSMINSDLWIRQKEL